MNDLDFGKSDATRYFGALQYFDSMDGLFWALFMSEISYSDGPKFSEVYPALLDSGTSIMLLPTNFISSYVSAHNGILTESSGIYRLGTYDLMETR